MNCYNHRSVPAVAICKNCNKGLCPDCLTEVDNGIACTATCVEDVNTINKLINTNKGSTARVAGSYTRTAFIYGAMGLLFLYTAWEYNDMKIYGIVAGSIFLIGAALTLNSAGKYKKQ
jgi:hypothetical protein